MQPDDFIACLAPGKRLWLQVHGASMRPLLRAGEELRLVRCSERELGAGHIAVLARSDGALIAHLVAGVAPLRTSTFSGTVDAPGLTVLGRADAVRRGGIEFPLAPSFVLGAHRAWMKVRTSTVARLAYDTIRGTVAAPLRRVLLGPITVELASDPLEVARFSSRFETVAPIQLDELVSTRAVAVARARGRIVGMATRGREPLVGVEGSGLGIEARLLAVWPPDVVPKPKTYLVPQLTDVPVVHPEAVLQCVDGRWMAATGDDRVHSFADATGSVSEVGERIAELIDGTRTVESIVNALCEEFEVDRVMCEADTLEFVRVLVERRVVSLTPSRTQSSPPGG